jgi:hypothetical protein
MGFITEVDQWVERCVSDPQWVADCLHRLYRFGGQHPESTVCRHSLEVWWMCSECSPAEQLWALVHDAHEILSGEITREWKADETREKQSDADAALRSALGISGVDLLKVHCADIKHGAIEFEQITTGVYSYHFNWYAARHKWAELFEELRSEL